MAKVKLNTSPAIQGKVDAGLSLLFGTAAVPVASDEKVQTIPISQIDDHPNQGRWSMDEDELNWLANNIAEIGVVEPVQLMVKPDGRYLMLAGHRRKEAALRAGLALLPALISPYNERRAAIIFNATNLGQRQKLRPSEKAFAYADLENAVGAGGKTSAAIAELTGDTVRMIQRYKRLTLLDEALMVAVDAGHIPVQAGVELSYLADDDQSVVLAGMEAEGIAKISAKQAQTIRALAAEDELTADKVHEVFASKLKRQNGEVGTIRLRRADFVDLLPADCSEADLCKLIRAALTAYLNQ